MAKVRAVLADASVWIEYLANRLPAFALLLQEGRIIVHPAVIGEVALGSLRNRDAILLSMQTMISADVADDAEVLRLVNARLHSRGIGWVDAHLVASAMLSDACLLTRDRRLAAVARDLAVAADL